MLHTLQEAGTPDGAAVVMESRDDEDAELRSVGSEFGPIALTVHPNGGYRVCQAGTAVCSNRASP